METINLSRKLAFAGRRCRVPFFTGPQFTNSVAGVPVLSQVRLFIEPSQWSDDNVMTIAREVARVVGPTEQFDVGLTLSTHLPYHPETPAAGHTARVMKMDRNDPSIVLRMSDGTGDRTFIARFPRLQFDPAGEDYWRSTLAPGVVKQSSQD